MKILVVEDQDNDLRTLEHYLRKMDYEVLTARSVPQAIEVYRSNKSIQILITDWYLPDEGDGGRLIEEIKEEGGHNIYTLMVTGAASREEIQEGLNAGVDDILLKPVERSLLQLRLWQARWRLDQKNIPDDRVQRIVQSIIGGESGLKTVMDAVVRVAPKDERVLLRGENGTGKEVIAKAIHDLSRRHMNTFLAVNCAAIPEALFESEFFGHVKGAFTGAVADKIGYFERADKGTLFLDEVGELTPAAQAKLLTVLQNGNVRPVGSTRSERKVDVRVISATNRNLEEMVKTGQFREDLYYRLHCYPVTLPPLRDRKEDIPLFVNHFINSNRGGVVHNASAAALTVLKGYRWPGNIRELDHVIRRAIVHSDGPTIEVAHIHEVLQKSQEATPLTATLDEQKEAFERRIIIDNLCVTHGNVEEVARRLGIHPNTLRGRLLKLSINAADYKNRA